MRTGSRAWESAAGAFDVAEDFARNDLIAIARARGRPAWGRARLWLDGGSEDPFRVGGEALAGALGIPMRHWPGAHEGDYWRAHYARYLLLRRRAGGVLRRPDDRRRERIDVADRKLRSRAWSDAVRALEHDRAAKVACPVCHAGNVAGDWVSFKSRSGGEWVLQCDACSAWYTEVRGGG